MPQYGWTNCPPPIRRQVQALTDGLRAALEPGLLGVYLHGSLAMGCFNPQRSDVDVLAVTAAPLIAPARAALAQLLLRLSGLPRAIEISVLAAPRLHPWRHPAPYEFHYSEDWRARTAAHLAAGDWPEAAATPTDADLAAHITLALARGVCLWGRPAPEVLPPVPPADYAASIVGDFHWGRDLLYLNPVYFVLNACRVRAFLEEGRLLSKDEGGQWGLARLAPAHHAVLRQALQTYRGELTTDAWSQPALEAFAADMAAALPQAT